MRCKPTLAGLAFCLVVNTAAYSQSKPMSLIVGMPAGGAYDMYGRLLARHLGAHLPGRPNVVVRQMPGAGGLISANYLFGAAPKDGSVIGIFSRGVPVLPIFDPAGIKFDPRQFSWIGSIAEETQVVFAWHTKPFKTFDDIVKREMTVGATGSGGDSLTFALALNRILDTKLKIVAGYPGAPDYYMAVERGELDGVAAASWSNLTGPFASFITDHKINVIVQLGVRKRADIPAPLVTDFAKNDLDKQVLDLIFSRQLFAYPVAAPPGVPQKTVSELRTAFIAALSDSALLDDAKKMGLDISPSSGDSVSEHIAAVLGAPSAVIQRARDMVRLDESK